jgi:hypothetical protein
MLVKSLFKAGLETKFYKHFVYDKEFTGNMNIDDKKSNFKKNFFRFLN